MPIDRTGRARSSASRRTWRNPGRASSGGPGRPHGHQPGHVEVLVTQGGDEFGHLGRRHPAAPGQAGHVHLDQDAGAGPAGGDGPPLGQAGHALPARRPAGPAGAPCCAGRPRGSATRGRVRGRRPGLRPWPPARRRSSPPPPSDPAASAVRTASGPNPLVTATSVTADGSGAAAPMRSRMAASRSANPGNGSARPGHGRRPGRPTTPRGPGARRRPGPGGRTAHRRRPCTRRRRRSSRPPAAVQRARPPRPPGRGPAALRGRGPDRRPVGVGDHVEVGRAELVAPGVDARAEDPRDVRRPPVAHGAAPPPRRRRPPGPASRRARRRRPLRGWPAPGGRSRR